MTAPSLASIAMPSRGQRVRAWWYETMPAGSDVFVGTPRGELQVVGGEYNDDAAQALPRSLRLDCASRPEGLMPGMWVRVAIYVGLEDDPNWSPFWLCTLPIVSVDSNLVRMGGATLQCGDPAVVLNNRPYTEDTTVSGSFSTFVYDTIHANYPDEAYIYVNVPNVPIPTGMVMEFGSGQWDGILKIADALNLTIRFSHYNDVFAFPRNYNAGVLTEIERVQTLPGGTRHDEVVPTLAHVLLSRGSDVPVLHGTATWEECLGEPPPSWYGPVVVTDRQEGGETATQADADGLAMELLKARLGQVTTYDNLSILPFDRFHIAAGGHIVTYEGLEYWIRAYSVRLPLGQTTVTLRRYIP